MLAERCRAISESPVFKNAVLVVIILNAILIGVETSPRMVQSAGGALDALGMLVQTAFVLEIVIRLAAFGPRPWRFFLDGWTVFDFAVVALSLLPAAGPFATVARLARVLRVARVVSSLPELRLIIGTMLRSIPSMGHVIVMLSILMYIFAVLGFHLFAGVDPPRWGTLPRALETLFVILTLEGWVEVYQESAEGAPWAWVFYASYIIVAVSVVVNLFIAVVINNLEATRKEEAAAGNGAADALAELERLRAQVDRVETVVRRVGSGG
jgi:voltage-gated sodium channel